MPELGKSPGRRPVRVADNIKIEIATLLLRKIKDPRVYLVTITEVMVTDDLRQARVYFSCGEGEEKNVEGGLNSAKGFIRKHLAKELGMRYVPELTFVHDLSLAKKAEMETIFREIASENE